MSNYGLKALSERECLLGEVNDYLDQSHQIGELALEEICLELDQHGICDCPPLGPSGEKQRDDSNFERLLEEAFKAFREQEREILLGVPTGLRRHGKITSDKWWWAAAHMRHHLEFFFVLRGIKPCLLFQDYSTKYTPIFSTIIIDCLVPIMDRLDLWSYGFNLSFYSFEWVFYDARCNKLPQITKIFLTHAFIVRRDDTGAYPYKENPFGVPDLEVAQALGYPIRADSLEGSRMVAIRDVTEIDALAAMGRPEPHCCVVGMGFECAEGDRIEWMRVVLHFLVCQQAARSVGTELILSTYEHPEMSAWLNLNLGVLGGQVETVDTIGHVSDEDIETSEDKHGDSQQ
ncbi:hypothetical protein J7T55_012450 [Diaporthe amygdali]|uniref:uncharacterized protein n=1 Tax=Phomopsis amygdali TaxID=1214568 RepID=UPI0022FDCE09|nr:uncharacterized protein J7T55_012450 [Diaporthe amygdali]KAJ0123977.1 hypothetical protein J7T55_012450 [Diaporthe amygdali]